MSVGISKKTINGNSVDVKTDGQKSRLVIFLAVSITLQVNKQRYIDRYNKRALKT